MGTKPTNRFIPYTAVDDIKRRVIWGAQVSCPSSWQIELFRRDNELCMSGGLADFDYGSWMKTVNPGECFTSPSTYLSVCTGDIDLLCTRLTSAMQRSYKDLPESSRTCR